jgi:2-polyprenyl-3-methyl-5-hydroxy-6-metoxy-1,4-benzoquinol methylase
LRKRSAFIVEHVTNHARRLGVRLKVLDIGCGLGEVALSVGAKGHEVTAVDIDPKSISFCNRRNQLANVVFRVGNGENLDLEETFDVVIVSEVLEHTPHPERPEWLLPLGDRGQQVNSEEQTHIDAVQVERDLQNVERRQHSFL